MIAFAFAPVPRAVALDNRLSPGARALYAVLQSHARKRGSCWPGYRRLCALLGRCENTVRRWMRTLIAAGLVEQQRRGQRKTNVYSLVLPAIPEPQNMRFPVKELDDLTISNENVSSGSTPALPLPQEPKPLPADVVALVLDIGRELRDSAPRSTLTRVERMIAASEKPMDMYDAVIAARSTTRRRLSRIRHRASSGQAQAMPYFLACLARAVGVTPAPVRAVAVTVAHSVPAEPPVRPAVTRDDARAIFWRAVHDACGVGDLRAYCRVAGRPPRYDDLRYSILLVKERRR